MIKHSKLQKGKGKRIKLQWQYRLLEMIRIIITFPQSMKRQFKLSWLLYKKMRIQRRIILDSLNEESIAKANEIVSEMFLSRHFIM
jgi:hypothetical protein